MEAIQDENLWKSERAKQKEIKQKEAITKVEKRINEIEKKAFVDYKMYI